MLLATEPFLSPLTEALFYFVCLLACFVLAFWSCCFVCFNCPLYWGRLSEREHMKLGGKDLEGVREGENMIEI